MLVGLYPIVGDLLHAGHIIAMQEAKEHCDYLIVALNCTPDNKQPIQSIFERWTQLDGVKYADKVIPYQGKIDLELMCQALPHDIRFVGADYINKTFDGKEIEEQNGVKIHYLKRSHTMSSTSLKERVRAHD